MPFSDGTAVARRPHHASPRRRPAARGSAPRAASPAAGTRAARRAGSGAGAAASVIVSAMAERGRWRRPRPSASRPDRRAAPTRCPARTASRNRATDANVNGCRMLSKGGTRDEPRVRQRDGASTSRCVISGPSDRTTSTPSAPRRRTTPRGRAARTATPPRTSGRSAREEHLAVSAAGTRDVHVGPARQVARGMERHLLGHPRRAADALLLLQRAERQQVGQRQQARRAPPRRARAAATRGVGAAAGVERGEHQREHHRRHAVVPAGLRGEREGHPGQDRGPRRPALARCGAARGGRARSSRWRAGSGGRRGSAWWDEKAASTSRQQPRPAVPGERVDEDVEGPARRRRGRGSWRR